MNTAIKTTALCAILAAGPPLAVHVGNEMSYEDPPPIAARTGLAPEVEVPEVPDRIAVEEVIVEAPAPKKAVRVAYRGPRSCETRVLEHTGGKVRVCGRPATPITHRKRDANELAKLYR